MDFIGSFNPMDIGERKEKFILNYFSKQITTISFHENIDLYENMT